MKHLIPLFKTYLVLFASAAAALAQHNRPLTRLEPIAIVKTIPPYPSFARAYRMQGLVELSAMINPEGKVTSVKLISGYPLLVSSAMAAAYKWTYQPASLDGVPISAPTLIRMNFRLEEGTGK